MRIEPETKRVSFFVDGQNLYHTVKDSFGCSHPNYDIRKLCEKLCEEQGSGWELSTVYFYTGVPSVQDNPHWHIFWTKKLAAMGREGIKVFSRPLKYRNKKVRCPDGVIHTFLDGDEKGIDARIAIDIIRKALANEYDVACILSQDQDLSEAADEVIKISQERDRWIQLASAFPSSPTSSNRRGINHTNWIPISRRLYDQCIDQRDFRATPREISGSQG